MFGPKMKSTRAVAAALLGVALAAMPFQASRALDGVSPTQSQMDASAARVKRDESRTDARLTRMYGRLRITPAQEDLWTKVAGVMRENAHTFRANLGERYKDGTSSSAVDDLKSFQIVADEHSSGLKKLIPAFEALYASLTPDQKKRADRMFARRERN